MKFLAPCLLVSFLVSSVAQAADVGPLAVGKPAGVRHAQDVGLGDNTLLYVALGAAVIAGIAIAASSGDDNKPTQQQVTTTTTTGTAS